MSGMIHICQPRPAPRPHGGAPSGEDRTGGDGREDPAFPKTSPPEPPEFRKLQKTRYTHSSICAMTCPFVYFNSLNDSMLWRIYKLILGVFLRKNDLFGRAQTKLNSIRKDFVDRL
jgi:hypothetical protein